LLQLVIGMIEKLDEAARPSGEVQVIQLPGSISGRTLQLALKAIGAEQPEPSTTENRRKNNNRNRNGRRRDRNRRGESQGRNGNTNADPLR